MRTSPILCAIDFSQGSQGALHYALALARAFRIRVILMSVDDPLLIDVADARMGHGWAARQTEQGLRELVIAAGGDAALGVVYEARSGKAAPAILDAARQHGCGLVIMGTHGRTGVRKLVFGATAERVLRDTTVPVLLVPHDPGPRSIEELARLAGTLLAPVDFGPSTSHQVSVAEAIARQFHLRAIVGHVFVPLDQPVPESIDPADVENERQRRACRGLRSIAIGAPARVTPEILIASGDPAAEIAKWVGDRHVGLLVMALRSDCAGGPRMGSVTYRTIAATGVLTLALPPVQP